MRSGCGGQAVSFNPDVSFGSWLCQGQNPNRRVGQLCQLSPAADPFISALVFTMDEGRRGGHRPDGRQGAASKRLAGLPPTFKEWRSGHLSRICVAPVAHQNAGAAA